MITQHLQPANAQLFLCLLQTDTKILWPFHKRIFPLLSFTVFCHICFTQTFLFVLNEDKYSWNKPHSVCLPSASQVVVCSDSPSLLPARRLFFFFLNICLICRWCDNVTGIILNHVVTFIMKPFCEFIQYKDRICLKYVVFTASTELSETFPF